MSDLIEICKGVHIHYEYPPYTLMLGFKNCTREIEFEDLQEIEIFLEATRQLRDWVKNEEMRTRLGIN